METHDISKEQNITAKMDQPLNTQTDKESGILKVIVIGKMVLRLNTITEIANGIDEANYIGKMVLQLRESMVMKNGIVIIFSIEKMDQP